MSEAYTRVLQGHVSFISLFLFISMSIHIHSFVICLFICTNLCVLQIAIDSAIFPEGTSGRQLDVLARKALWKEGMNYAVCVVVFLYSLTLTFYCFVSMVQVMVSVLS